MVNWINSWKKGNKKNKYSLTLRFGRLTAFELKFCLCNEEGCGKFRIMLFNFGFEV